MNHEDLDGLIKELKRDSSGFSFFERDQAFWNEIWDRIKRIGLHFRETQYPTRSDKDQAWHTFQAVVDAIKERQSAYRKEQQREFVGRSTSHTYRIIEEASKAWPWTDGFSELVCLLCGYTILEKLVDLAFDAFEALTGTGPDSPAQKRKFVLQTKSRHMASAFALFGSCKREMTGEDRAKASEILTKTRIELDRAWSELKTELKAKHEEWIKREGEFKFRQNQKERLIETAQGLDPSDSEDREKAKSLDKHWKQVGFAGKTHEERLWGAFRTALDRFWEKTNALAAERKKNWERNQARFEANRSTKKDIIRSIGRLDPSDPEDFNELNRLKEQWRDAGPAGRDHEDDLWSKYRDALNQFYTAKREIRRDKLTQALERKEEHLAKLESWIERDEAMLAESEEKLRDAWSDSFREKMEAKIESLESRLEENREQRDDVQDAVQDIRDKIRQLE